MGKYLILNWNEIEWAPHLMELDILYDFSKAKIKFKLRQNRMWKWDIEIGKQNEQKARDELREWAKAQSDLDQIDIASPCLGPFLWFSVDSRCGKHLCNQVAATNNPFGLCFFVQNISCTHFSVGVNSNERKIENTRIYSILNQSNLEGANK